MAVTNATIANIPFIPYLPMMVTNVGGDTQLTVIKPYQPNQLGIYFNLVAQQSWGTPGIMPGSVFQPYVPNQQQIQDLSKMFLGVVA